MLLCAHKSLKGGIFDLPQVIEYAKPLSDSADSQFANVAAQVPVENLIGGDFIESIPPCKVYTMKRTLHDWRDEHARCILRNIEKAIVLGGNRKLIILEEMLDTKRSARLSRYGDINMMMTADGVERTRDERITLADSARWTITKIYPFRNAWHCAFDLVPRAWSNKS